MTDRKWSPNQDDGGNWWLKLAEINEYQNDGDLFCYVHNLCLCFEQHKESVTSMLVTDVGDQMWPIQDAGESCPMMTDLIHWENHENNEKSRQYNDSATNI